MQTSLTFNSTITLFSIMLVGALAPSVSVLTVSTRSAASGFIHGIFTTLGIALGDVIFILIAIFGLSFLAETMGDLFVLMKYLGGCYLIWLGITLWRSKSKPIETEKIADTSLFSSLLAGLFITLGDQKAILFYLGMFPALIDLSALSYVDTAIIILIAIIAISTKLGYAFMADKTRLLLQHTILIRRINIFAGTVMVGAGIYLLALALLR